MQHITPCKHHHKVTSYVKTSRHNDYLTVQCSLFSSWPNCDSFNTEQAKDKGYASFPGGHLTLQKQYWR